MQESILIISDEELEEHQLEELKFRYNIYHILEVPVQIVKAWVNINPLGEFDISYLREMKEFLTEKKREGCRYIYLKGDKGAEHYMVSYAMGIGMVPLYATTYHSVSSEVREERENHHICFRKYVGLETK